jgi:uncharacterized iron-regulated membrane protein
VLLIIIRNKDATLNRESQESRETGLAKTGKKQVRALWLQVHKWIGLTLAILIIPICLTGSALVWHDWLDAKVEPQRHVVLGPPTLPASAYEASARAHLDAGEALSELRFSKDGTPVVAVATRVAEGGGRPVRTSLWLDPRDASLIDRLTGNSGLVQVMHVLHGSLMRPGWGRTVVGWVGAFMFVSCLTGIWLWWPLSGSVATGFRWKRRNTVNANLHYLTGFWVLIPLAMLSFTGAWISFPKLFSQFESRPAPPGPSRATPIEAPSLTIDAAVAAARPYGTGALASIAWPTDQKAEWKIGFNRRGANAIVPVDDRTARATPAPPPQPETLARTMRRWHDGTGMGAIWQATIFLGGIIPALLSVTGIIIWWRARRPRQKARDFQRLAALEG